MSIGALSGFELLDSSEALNSGGTFSIVTSPTAGSWSGGALRANPTTTATGWFQIAGRAGGGTTTASAYSFTDAWHRFRFRPDTLPSSLSEEICQVINTGGGVKAVLRINSSGNLMIFDSNGTTQVGSTGTTALSTGTWYTIEFRVGNNVNLECRINEAVEITTSSTPTSTVNNGSIKLGKAVNRNGKTVDFYYDDYIVSDTAYPGIGRSAILLPNANGNYQLWTIGAGSGSNYQQVDEVPHDGDTTYLLSPLIISKNETEALTNTATASIVGTPNAAMNCGVFKRDNALNAGTVKLLLRSGSTDDLTSSNYTTTTSYVLIGKVYSTDPATGSAWTTVGLDGCESGAQNESASLQVRATMFGLLVDWIPAVSYTYSGGGGVQLGGSALWSQTKAYGGLGGLSFAGSAAVAKTRIVTGSGGVAFGGAGSVSKTRVVIGSGGVQFAGSAAAATIRVATGSGGIAFSGAAAAAREKAYTPSGGISLAGSAAIAIDKAFQGSSGISLGGSAEVEFQTGATPAAPSVPASMGGGNARPRRIAPDRFRPVDEPSVEEPVLESRIYSYAGSGGLLLGGTAAISFTPGLPIDSNPLAELRPAETAIVPSVFIYSGSWRLRLGGASAAVFVDPWRKVRDAEERSLLGLVDDDTILFLGA